MTRPSDDAIAQAFEREISVLPKGVQDNIRDAMQREESVSWQMFKAGWHSHEIDAAKRFIAQSRNPNLPLPEISIKPADDTQWVMVPREPTLKMRNAGWRDVSAQGLDAEDIDVATLYAAMLAAAPTPPKQEPAGYAHSTPLGGMTALGILTTKVPHGTKLYTAQPAPTTDDDVRRDAERYRWLRCGGWEVMQDPKYWPEHLRFDGAIDAAIREASGESRDAK